VTNNGVLNVGEAGFPGALRINGDLVLLQNSVLVFDIAGLQVVIGYDALDVSGNIALNGIIRLDVNPDAYNSSNASFNDLFTPLKYASQTGSATLVSTAGYNFAIVVGDTGIEGVFMPVSFVMNSPNHWTNSDKVGPKHIIFVSEDLKFKGKPKGLSAAFLPDNLRAHRKSIEQVALNLPCESSDEQVTGYGFSDNKKASDKKTIIVRLTSVDGSKLAYVVSF